jgi:hypothetical protein
MMRTLVVAPAEMHADALCGNVRERGVERLDMFGGARSKLLQLEIGVLDVPAHREVGAINLKIEAGRDDRFVFRLHRL